MNSEFSVTTTEWVLLGFILAGLAWQYLLVCRVKSAELRIAEFQAWIITAIAFVTAWVITCVFIN